MDFLTKLAANFNLSPWLLFAALFVGSILFLLALREFLSWYLRVYDLKDEIRALRIASLELKRELNEIKKEGIVASKASSDSSKGSKKVSAMDSFATTSSFDETKNKASQEQRQDRFTLDH